MGTKPSPPNAEQAQVAQPVQAIGKRVFSRGNDDPPSPIYVNAVEFISMGMDVFMDTGVVPPESVSAAIERKPAESSPTVDIYVSFRFGMSLQTAAQMHQKLTEMLQQTHSQMAATVQSGQPRTK